VPPPGLSGSILAVLKVPYANACRKRTHFSKSSGVQVNQKTLVYEFWNGASCGEELYFLGTSQDAAFQNQAAERYRLEPYIDAFADFASARGLRVLEIGVGLGADHERFARAGAKLSGIDLTPRAVEFTRRRFEVLNLPCDVRVGDAEALEFEDETFDIVYSWGVLHHTPDTAKAIQEVLRVLKPGGVARIMMYHKNSMVGFMLWLRYAFAELHWKTSLQDIYSRYLESPGTKAYSKTEARNLMSGFQDIHLRTTLTHADLLESAAGQRHRGLLLDVAKKLWPRWLIRKLLPECGLFLMITARKPR